MYASIGGGIELDAGIVAYASYVPHLRIKKEEYQKAWSGLGSGIKEKAVADIDEDPVSMPVEAGRQVLGDVDPAGVDVLVHASANYPYAEKVMSGTLAGALGLPPTSWLWNWAAPVSPVRGRCSWPWNCWPIESGGWPWSWWPTIPPPGLGAASCAFLLGKENVAVRVEGWTGQVRESLGTRLRASGEAYQREPGVKTLQTEAYTGTIGPAVKELVASLALGPGQYRHVVFSQPASRLPLSLGRALGFTTGQMEAGLLYDQTGDTGACSALLGLCAVLDQAKAGERILVAGFGAGAHAASLVVDGRPRRSGPGVRQWLDRKTYIDYVVSTAH